MPKMQMVVRRITQPFSSIFLFSATLLSSLLFPTMFPSSLLRRAGLIVQNRAGD